MIGYSQTNLTYLARRRSFYRVTSFALTCTIELASNVTADTLVLLICRIGIQIEF